LEEESDSYFFWCNELASLGLVYHFEPPQSVVQGRPAQGSAGGAPVWPWKKEGDLLQGPNGCRAPLARAYGLNATEMGSIPAAKGDPATGVRAPLAPTL
jgi:hypothetical protein